MRKIVYAGLLALAAGGSPAATQAQDAETFYRGKTVQLYIGFGPGGSYDLYARLLARHIGKHIPGNPEVVPFNQEGAGSMLLANWLYNVAPKDGTVIATISRAVPFFPLIDKDASAAQFEASKFTWIGSANDEVSTCVAWTASGIESVDDLKTKGMILGGDGPTADGEQFARLMNGVLGTKINIVTGYGGSGDLNVAMERGEIQGRCGWSWSSVVASHSDWLESGQIKVLMQMGSKPHPDLKDVPTLSEAITDPEDRQIVDIVLARQPLGRPFLAPPGIPEDRAEVLRKAFMDTMADPDFLAEAKKVKLEVVPLSGEDVQAVVERAYAAATENVKIRTRDMLSP